MALASIYRVVQDVQGNVVTEVLGTVLLSGTSTLAALYSDAAGTLPLPNPLSNNSQYGSFNVFVAAGTYDMQFVKVGYTFETQRNITLRNPTAGVDQILGTVNQIGTNPNPGIGNVTLVLPQDIAPDSSVQFGHLGLGTPAVPTRGLLVETDAEVRGSLMVDSPTFTVDATTNSVGMGIPGGAPWALRVQNVEVVGGFVVDNPTLTVDPVTNSVGFGVAPSAGWSLRAQSAEVIGNFAVDTPTFQVDAALNAIGCGVTPVTGYSLTANTMQVLSTFTVDTPTLTVDPAANSVGFGVAPIAGRSFAALNPHMTQVVIGPATGLPADTFQQVWYQKAASYGMTFTPTDNDTGPGGALRFQNTAGTLVGMIHTTASATTYNTSSDARLKHAIANLTGELALLKLLRPVSFLWNVDDSPGVGFLAHEVAGHIQGMVTGEPDALDPEGQVLPQLIDYSKLVPFLVGAIQTLAQRLEVVEDAVGA